MIEIVYSKEINKKDEYLRLPKNIKQTGIVEEHKKVYIEDYVDTFMEQFLDDVGESRGVLILTGKTVYNSGCNYTFVEGCLWVKEIEIVGREIFFNDKIWMNIHSQVKKFFSLADIVGWAIVSKDELMGVNDSIVKIHNDNFPGKEKILITKEILEKEQIIYNMENGIMREHRGYYTYYEKNPQMQAYMINVKESLEKKEQWEDKATKSFRTIIKEKEEIKQQRIKRNTKILKTASLLLVVIIGTATFYNYDKLETLQTDLEYLSKNVNEQQVKEWFADAKNGLSEGIEKEMDNLSTNASKEDVAGAEGEENSANTSSTTSENTEITDEYTLEVNNISGNVEKEEKNDQTSGQATDKGEINSGEGENTKETVSGSVTEISSTESEITENVNEEAAEEKAEPIEEKQNTYIVQNGDSLEKISIKLYGDTSKVAEICQLNEISDIDKIFIGQELIVP